MATLPVYVHSDAKIGATGPKLPPEELELICVLYSMPVRSQRFHTARQVGCAFPDSDTELGKVGVYELIWRFEDDDWFVYLTHTGFQLEIRRMSKGQSLIDTANGAQWLSLATGMMRHLHEILATTNSEV